MSADQTFDAFPSGIARKAEDDKAVLLTHGQMIITLSIAQARELSMSLARAADQAELRLPEGQ